MDSPGGKLAALNAAAGNLSKLADTAEAERNWDEELRGLTGVASHGIQVLAGAVLDVRKKQASQERLQTQVDSVQSQINEVESAAVAVSNRIAELSEELSAQLAELKAELSTKQNAEQVSAELTAFRTVHEKFQTKLQRCKTDEEQLHAQAETSMARLDNTSRNVVDTAKRCQKLERKLTELEARTQTDMQSVHDKCKKMRTEWQKSEGGISPRLLHRSSGLMGENSEDFKALQERVAALETQLPQTCAVLSKKVHETATKFQNLNMELADRVVKHRNEAAERAIVSFRHKWREAHVARAKRWIERWFVRYRTRSDQQASVVQGMVRLQRLIGQRRVVPRFRTWLYASQKDMHTGTFEQLMESTNAIQTQVSQMATTNAKKEKVQSEQTENLMYRTASLESRVDNLSSKKADALTVKEQLRHLENSITQSSEFDRLQKLIEDVDERIRPMEKKKADLSVVEMYAGRLNRLSFEYTRNFTRLDEEVRARATIDDFKDKADTKTVEKAMVLLSSQMDRLAQVNGQDMENLRNTLVQYLELSPDLRKAALSQGIKSTEGCMVCKDGGKGRNENCLFCKDPKNAAPPIRGTDDKLYQHMAIESHQNYWVGAANLVDTRLRTPTRLGSAVGRRQDAMSPTSAMSEEKVAFSMDQLLRTTLAEAEGLKPKSQDDRRSSIKSYFRASASGSPDKRDTATPRRLYQVGPGALPDVHAVNRSGISEVECGYNGY